VGLVVLSDEARDVLEEVLSGLPAIRRRGIAAPSNEILRSITIALIMMIQQALDDPAHRARRVTQRRRRRREDRLFLLRRVLRRATMDAQVSIVRRFSNSRLRWRSSAPTHWRRGWRGSSWSVAFTRLSGRLATFRVS
jgi:hypothetical protein